jgi:hypothetical protein
MDAFVRSRRPTLAARQFSVGSLPSLPEANRAYKTASFVPAATNRGARLIYQNETVCAPNEAPATLRRDSAALLPLHRE